VFYWCFIGVLLVFWVVMVGAFGAAGNDDYNRKCANAHKMNPNETCEIK
jgi:hypothetical protein